MKSRLMFAMLVGVIMISLSLSAFAQLYPYADKFGHTFSIVARDPETGDMGVAVQSHWFSVGSAVTWAEAGVGAIATQSFINPWYGQHGLELLKAGKTAQEALKEMVDADEGRDVRQVAIVDAKGNVAAWTGKGCIVAAGHITGDGFSVQANMMLNDKVWPAMEAAYKSTSGPLEDRLVAALEAAQKAGGDIRGKQSAAILVVTKNATGNLWQDRRVDLRIEDHAEPVAEMRRLLNLYKAYQHMSNGDLAVEKNDAEGALREYGTAGNMFPDNLEMKYWHAFALVNMGKTDDALPMFKAIFAKDANWKTLTERLKANGMLQAKDDDFKKIMEQ